MKPGYKQTEVGVIPEEWEVKRISAATSLLKCAVAEDPGVRLIEEVRFHIDAGGVSLRFVWKAEIVVVEVVE
jgi:hypothetical protein